MEYIAEKDYYPRKHFFGLRLNLRKYYYDLNIFHDNFTHNRYRIKKNPGVVVDIGANVGAFTLRCLREGADFVYAYEPEKTNYDHLCEHVKLNGYEDKVRCFRRGVGEPGRTKLYVHPRTSAGSSAHFELINGLEKDKYQMVEFVSIKDVMRDIEHCNLLKLDCEGSERMIIDELNDELVKKIDQIAVEFHRYSGQEKRGLVKKLEKWYKGEITDGKKRVWVFTK